MNLTSLRAFAALPCLLLLAACQMTTFEKSPLTATNGCDPAAMGRWEVVDPEAAPGTPAEVALELDEACRLVIEETKRDGIVRGDATPLRMARAGDYGYAWVDAGWALRRFGEDHEFPRGDVVLMRWDIDGDTLRIWNIDDKATAHAIIDGELTGEVEFADSALFNRLTGEQPAEVLDRAGLFVAEAATFTRVPDRR